MQKFLAVLGGLFAILCIIGGGVFCFFNSINWDH